MFPFSPFFFCLFTVAQDLTGLSDPFCKLKYEGKVQKTNVVRENLNPEWNESFDFEYVPGASMKIEVFDWDFLGSNDFMGTVVINMSAVTHSYTQVYPFFFFFF